MEGARGACEMATYHPSFGDDDRNVLKCSGIQIVHIELDFIDINLLVNLSGKKSRLLRRFTLNEKTSHLTTLEIREC